MVMIRNIQQLLIIICIMIELTIADNIMIDKSSPNHVVNNRVASLIDTFQRSGVNLSNIGTGFRVPICLRSCVSNLTSVVHQVIFNSVRQQQPSDSMCKEFMSAKTCLVRSSNCPPDVLKMATNLIDGLCRGQSAAAAADALPCIDEVVGIVKSDCEQRCSVGEQINKIGEQKQKSPIETNNDGKSIINQPAMNDLCTATDCYIVCAREQMTSRCKNKLGTILSPKSSNGASGKTSLNSITSIIPAEFAKILQSAVPDKCQSLVNDMISNAGSQPLGDTLSNLNLEQFLGQLAEGVDAKDLALKNQTNTNNNHPSIDQHPPLKNVPEKVIYDNRVCRVDGKRLGGTV